MGRKNKPKEQADQSPFKVRNLLTHLLALVLGSGLVWQVAQWNIQKENQATEYRKQVIAAQEKILNLTREIFEAKKAGEDEYISTLKMLFQQYKLHQADYEFWEGKLAAAEGRPHKRVDFIPPFPPMNLRLQ
jgi:hypothetical protein